MTLTLFGLHFDPILEDSDGQDGLPKQLHGNGPYGTGQCQVVWCEDDPLYAFLQNLRDGKDAILIAARATSNPLAPRWQDGHGWGYIHPEDSPAVGPVLTKQFKQVAKSELDETRATIGHEAESFLIDCGINGGSMRQYVPEHYRASSARIANIDPEIADRHDLMHNAYNNMKEIDNKSIYFLQDQGAAEINISILATHMKQNWTKLERSARKRRNS